MSVDRAEVERIAKLAQLRFADAELDRLTDEMNRILGHAERLALNDDGAGAAATGHAPDGFARDALAGVRDAGLRAPDRLSDPPESFAPRWQDGFFVVPPPPGVTAESE